MQAWGKYVVGTGYNIRVISISSGNMPGRGRQQERLISVGVRDFNNDRYAKIPQSAGPILRFDWRKLLDRCGIS